MKQEQPTHHQAHPKNHHGHRIITLAATIRKQKEVIPSDVLGSYTGSDEQNKANRMQMIYNAKERPDKCPIFLF